MKTTININGLDVEFSDQKPTRAGAYWYSVHHEMTPSLMHVHKSELGELYVPGEGRLAHWCEVGLWSAPLVPAVEVGSAFTEGHMAGVVTAIKGGTCLGDWSESRASKIVEGTL